MCVSREFREACALLLLVVLVAALWPLAAACLLLIKHGVRLHWCTPEKMYPQGLPKWGYRTSPAHRGLAVRCPWFEVGFYIVKSK